MFFLINGNVSPGLDASFILFSCSALVENIKEFFAFFILTASNPYALTSRP